MRKPYILLLVIAMMMCTVIAQAQTKRDADKLASKIEKRLLSQQIEGLLPEIDRCIEMYRALGLQGSKEYATALTEKSAYYYYLEEYENCLPLELEVEKIYEQYFDTDPKELITSKTDIALLYLFLGDETNAKKYYYSAIDLFSDLPNPGKSLSAVVYNSLGDILYYSGDALGAIQMYETSLPLLKATKKENGDQYLHTELALVECYNNVLRFTDAYPLALDVWKHCQGVSDAEKAFIVQNLAMTEAGMFKWPEAISHLHEARGYYKRAGQEVSYYYADNLLREVDYLISTNDFQTAGLLVEEALGVIEAFGGIQTPIYALAMGKAAIADGMAGNSSRIEQYEKGVWNIVGDNPEGIGYKGLIISAYTLVGRYDDAIRLGNELRSAEVTAPGLLIEQMSVLNDLSKAYVFSGNVSEAILMSEECISRCKNARDDEALNIAYRMHRDVLSYTGDYLATETAAKLVLEHANKAFADGSPRVMEAMMALANLYYSNKQFSKSLDLLNQIMAYMKAAHVDKTVDYAVLLGTMTGSLFELRDYQATEDIALQALALLEELGAFDSDQYGSVLATLQDIYIYKTDYRKFSNIFSKYEPFILKKYGENSQQYAMLLVNKASAEKMAGNNAASGAIWDRIAGIVKSLELKDGEQLNTTLLINLAQNPNFEDGDLVLKSLLDNPDSGGTEYKNWLRLFLSFRYLSVGDVELAKEYFYQIELDDIRFSSSSRAFYSYVMFFYAQFGDYDKAYMIGRELVKDEMILDGSLLFGLPFCLMPVLSYYKDDYASMDMHVSDYEDVVFSFIRQNLPNMTYQQKSRFMDSYGVFLQNYMPMLSSFTGTATTAMAAYDGLLIGKGLLLNTEINLRQILKNKKDNKTLELYDRVQSMHMTLSGMEDGTGKEAYESTLAEAESELLDKIARYGDYTANFNTGWNDVRKALKKKELAVEFASYYADDECCYVAITLKHDDDYPKVISICTEDDLKEISKYDLYTTSRLYELVWKPLEERLAGVNTVFFSPVGELNNIAVEYAFTGTCYLNELINPVRLSSTRQVCMKRRNPSFKDAALYGNISYGASTDSLRIANASIQTSSGSRPRYVVDVDANRTSPLPATAGEIRSIDRALSSKGGRVRILSGANATEESVKALSGQSPDILHIATHGFYWSESEALTIDFTRSYQESDNMISEDKALSRSGLLMAGCDNYLYKHSLPDNMDDGVLTALEISAIDLGGTDLVVMSACQTGLGELSGDGVFGLQRAFKKAGVQSLLMSLWKVDDEATGLLMSQFYSALAEGKTEYEALYSAQKAVRETPGFDDPYYWAAFVLLDGLH